MMHRTKPYGVLLLIFTILTTAQANKEQQVSQKMPLGDNDNAGCFTISNNIDLESMEQVFNTAPQQAKDIVSHLQNPNFLKNIQYRYAIFVGAPGTGKTEMAKVIAYKMEQAGWLTVYIGSGDVAGDKRNQTAVRLRQELATAQAQCKPVILIIDELNELLEHSENEHYDTSTTSKFLWGFIDSQTNNPNFFMIGTMNRDTKLPQPFKNRVFARRIEFTAPADPAIKRSSFHSRLVKGGIKLENDVDNVYLDEMIQQCKDCGFRDLGEIALKARFIYRKHTPDSNDIVLSKTDITQAFKECAQAKTEMDYWHKEETEEERQERHFVQRIVIENLIRQCQETHYEYASIGSDLRVNKTWQTMSPECIAALGGLFSESQQMLAGAFNNRSEDAKENKKRELEELKELEKKAYEKLHWYKRWFTKRPK